MRNEKSVFTKFFPLMVLIAAGLILCGCASQKPEVKHEDTSKLNIVAAIFPAWDWTRSVLGENPAGMELTLLLDNGVDLHSFQPSAKDILTIANADLFIYVGGESDQWVTDALKQSGNPKLKVLKMLDAVGDAAKTEETVEGMQADEEEEEEAFDEHVWLSLRNAAVITDAICSELSALDPDHADIYRNNADGYKEKLTSLDEAYQQALADIPNHTLLFGDRFPFRYLTEDYGLDYYAAFSGCSAETEATFETISFLARKCDELGLKNILTIDGNDQRIAGTIIKSTETKDQQILTLDSMQSVTAKQIENGTTYLSIMEKDLDVLQKALEVK